MCSVNPSRICGGVTFAVVAVALAAITAIALAIIFAPPFLAAYAAVALYVSVGCGIGAAVATLAAIILLRNSSSHSSEIEPATETPSQRTTRFNNYFATANAKFEIGGEKETFKSRATTVINLIKSNSNFNAFEKQYNEIHAKFDLQKDPGAESVDQIINELVDLLEKMEPKSTDEDLSA